MRDFTRLPSHREVQAKKAAEAAFQKRTTDALQGLPDDIKAFNGIVRPDIAEKDCRPQKDKVPASLPFKVGDRVSILGGWREGEFGVIVAYDGSRLPWQVRFADLTVAWNATLFLSLA